MVKLLSILILVLAVILFPPASLALVSNNAVPGDATYPIKRTLEDGIYAIASLNPITRAWFSAARSDRRFKEFSTLIAQGKSASDTLDELVAQTQVAASEIEKVSDLVRRQELINQLSQSIDKYDQKLQEVSQALPATSISEVASQPTISTIVEPSLPPTFGSTPVPVTTETTPKLPEVPQPAVKPKEETPATTPITREDADDAKEKFEDIKKKLKEEKKSHSQQFREDRKDDEKEEDSKKDKNKEDEKEDFKTGKTDKKSKD